MSDMIDLSKPSKTKKTSKKTAAPIVAKKAAAPAKKTVTPKVVAKKSKAKKSKVTRPVYSEETISSRIKKAFIAWKKGEQTLAEIARAEGTKRNPVWIQFRMLAGGTEEALHRLRAKGAGGAQGKLRFKKAK